MSRITICTAVGGNRPFLTKLWRSPAEKPKPEVYIDEKGKEHVRFPTWCTFEVDLTHTKMKRSRRGNDCPGRRALSAAPSIWSDAHLKFFSGIAV